MKSIYSCFNATLGRLSIMWHLLNKSHTNVHTIAYILGSVSVFGYLVSFLRDRAFAHYFGVGELLDIYVASFRIPDMLFITATAFISVYALLPMFEEKKREGLLQEFIDTTFYFLLLFLVLGAVLLFFLIPVLGERLFHGFSGESFDTFVLFSRVFLIQAALFAVSSFFTSLLQFKRKFFLYSLLPILYNMGIIVGVIFFYPLYGAPGLALGVLIGIVLNVLIQIPVILRNGLIPRLMPTQRMVVECWRAVKLSVPRASALLSVSVAQIVIFGAIVSISEGVLSVYYFADNLKSVPLVVVGAAYSVASFPILVNYFTDHNMTAFRETVEGSLRRLFLFILPLIAYVFALREPLISLFFETGQFTSETTFITGTIVGVFALSALTMSILTICARALYACRRSFIPFCVFFSLAFAEIVSVHAVVRYFQHHREIVTLVQDITGLASVQYGALFTTVAIIVFLEGVAAVVILVALSRVIRQELRPIAKSFFQHLSAVVLLVITVIALKGTLFSGVTYNSLAGVCAIGGMGVIGAAVWYTALRIIGNEESDVLRERISHGIRLVWRK